jgi:hypothetical protein
MNMEPELDDNSEHEKKFILDQLKFDKSVKYKMLTSFIIGISSGFLVGIVVTTLLFSYVGGLYIPPDTVSATTVLSIISIALIIWGMRRSFIARF